ncbi:MAG: hypothetical protein ACI9V1_001887 [Spirosomataceae bacterium]
MLSWELQFRDFYDEMFDHFCTEIEQRLSNGTSFENAMAEASKMFSGYKYGSALSGKYYGLKAYEMEWEAKFRKRNNALIISELKSQVVSAKMLIWVIAYIIIYQATIYFDAPKLWAFFLIPSIILLILTLTYIYSWKGFKWKSFFVRKVMFTGIHKSKETLFSAPSTFIRQGTFFLGLFNLILHVPRLFIDDYSIPLHLGIAFSVLMMLLSYVFYEVVKKGMEVEKERTIFEVNP